MKLLVCGATGYLGSHVAAAARARGHEVLGIARSVSSAAKLRAAGIEPASGDLIDLSSIVPLIDRVDAVIFIAQLMLEEEFAAANAVLSRMEGTGKTFIFTSGTGLISQRTDGDWSEDSFAEDDPFVPSKYIGARLDTELMVRGFAERGVRAAFDAMSFTHRREWVEAVEGAKRPETRARRIAQAVDAARARIA